MEEIASDIFMGTFTIKWQEAARVSAELLDGTLYARYDDLPDASAWTPAPPTADGNPAPASDFQWGVGVAGGFADLCQRRSAEAGAGDGSYTARNGAVIEQSQILTTHNLAPLVAALELTELVGELAPQLTADAFGRIVRQQTTRRDDWRAQLQAVKYTAYAWRQAIFFPSLAEEATQHEIIDGWWERWSDGSTDWQTRFKPALAGLERVFAGDRFDTGGHTGGGRRFFGRSVGPHWLNPPRRGRRDGGA